MKTLCVFVFVNRIFCILHTLRRRKFLIVIVVKSTIILAVNTHTDTDDKKDVAKTEMDAQRSVTCL